MGRTTDEKTRAKQPRGGTPRPRWDGERGQLWLGPELLHQFEKPALAVIAFLSAFEVAGWPTTGVPVPLPRERRESATDFRQRVGTTVKNLNRTVRHTRLHFRLTYDRKGVRWEIVARRRHV
jgi:hypothetical protein